MEESYAFFHAIFDLILTYQSIEKDIKTFTHYCSNIEEINKDKILLAHTKKAIVSQKKICKLAQLLKKTEKFEKVKKDIEKAINFDAFTQKDLLGNLQIIARFLKRSHLKTFIQLEPLFTLLIGVGPAQELVEISKEIRILQKDLQHFTSLYIATESVRESSFLTNDKVQLLLSVIKN